MNTLNWALQKNDDKITLLLTGALSRHTLLSLWRQRETVLSAQNLDKPFIEWDLSGLERIDSAGFAALCDFLQMCQKLPHKTVRLIHPPQQLLTLADLVGLAHWIANFMALNSNGNPNGTARN